MMTAIVRATAKYANVRHGNHNCIADCLGLVAPALVLSNTDPCKGPVLKYQVESFYCTFQQYIVAMP